MEISFPDESSRRLLDYSISDNNSNITSGLLSVTEIKETTNSDFNLKKKFIVTKHIEQDPLNSPKSLLDESELFSCNSECTTPISENISKSLFNLNDNSIRKNFELDKSGLNSAPNTANSTPNDIKSKFTFKSISINSNNNNNEIESINRENDDVFDENHHVDLNGYDLNNNNNRDAEGQDTITSLKNPIFVKQLAEIKRKASIKSNKSGSANSIPVQIGSITNLPLEVPATPQSRRHFLSNIFFKSQESIISKKDKEPSKPLLNDQQTDLNTSISTVNSRKQHAINNRRISTRLKSTSESNSTNIAHNTEELFDAINEAINKNKDDVEYSKKLMEQIQILVAQNDDTERRKRRYLKRFIKLFACCFVLFTLLMGIVVITSLIIQIQRIEQNNLYSRNLTNNVTGTFQINLNNNHTFFKIVDLIIPNKQKQKIL